jgi:hypothetical protein
MRMHPFNTFTLFSTHFETEPFPAVLSFGAGNHVPACICEGGRISQRRPGPRGVIYFSANVCASRGEEERRGVWRALA